MISLFSFLWFPGNTCSDPGRPVNGDRRGDDFTVGSTVTYTCNSGYRLKGAKSVFCQRNRQWSESQPTCEREWSRVDFVNQNEISAIHSMINLMIFWLLEQNFGVLLLSFQCFFFRQIIFWFVFYLSLWKLFCCPRWDVGFVSRSLKCGLFFYKFHESSSPKRLLFFQGFVLIRVFLDLGSESAMISESAVRCPILAKMAINSREMTRVLAVTMASGQGIFQPVKVSGFLPMWHIHLSRTVGLVISSPLSFFLCLLCLSFSPLSLSLFPFPWPFHQLSETCLGSKNKYCGIYKNC